MFAAIVISSFLLDRFKSNNGLTLLEIALLVIAIIGANGVFFLAARSIKNEVSRKYGED
jgi:hypothetical protein